MIYDDLDPNEIYAHIEHAQNVLRPYVETPLRIQKAMLGPMFGNPAGDLNGFTMGAERDDPDNHHYEMMTRVLPEIAHSAPRWSVASRTGGGRRDYLLGIQTGLNRWAAQQELHKVAQRQAVDYQSGWCASVVTMQSNDVMQRRTQRSRRMARSLYRDGAMVADMSEMDEGHATWPKHIRKSMTDLLWDMDADSWDERKWTCHRVRMDRRALIKVAKANPEQGWKLEEIETQPANATHGMMLGDPRRNEIGSPTIDQFRKTIEFFEVHILGYRLPDADEFEEKIGRETHGTLVTVAKSGQGGVFLRDPRPYAGPRTGAHRISGAYWIGDERVPLSHAVAVERQVNDLNDIARAIRRGAQEYRRIVLYDPEVGGLKRHLQAAGDNMLVPYPGMMKDGNKPAVMNVELGGITDQMLRWFGLAKDRLDRVSGHIDTDSGQAQPGLTATVGSLAAMGSSARRAGMLQGFHDHQSWVGRSVAHYLIKDEGVSFALAGEDAEMIAKELGLDQPGTIPDDVALDMGFSPDRAAWMPGEELRFRGGTSDIDLDELAVDFDVSSGGHKDQGQRYVEVNNAIGGLVNMLPMMAQTPEAVKWKDVLELLGSVQDIPGFANLVNVEQLTGTDFAGLPQVELATTARADSGGAPGVINLSSVRGGQGGQSGQSGQSGGGER